MKRAVQDSDWRGKLYFVRNNARNQEIRLKFKTASVKMDAANEKRGVRKMPIEDAEKFSKAAQTKAQLLKEHKGVYFLRAVVAGFFIVCAMIFSNVVANTFLNSDPATGKLLAAIVFSLAVLLIVFVGGELFTGNNFVMAFGAFDGKVSWKEVFKVWGVSYAGNFIGCVLLSLIFVLAGAAGTKDYYKIIMDVKIAVPESEIFFRAILCNFFVCLAVLCGTKCKGDSLKFLMIVMCIASFVISGFEHCIANMATFSTALMLGYDYSIVKLLECLVIDTIGNAIGGGMLLAWPICRMCVREKKV